MSAEEVFVPEQKMCSNCGGKMSFDPEKCALACKVCNTVETIEALKERNDEKQDFIAALNLLPQHEEAEMLLVRCSSCGAEVAFPPNITAHKCCYCGTPLVAHAAGKRLLKPDALLPFKITDEQAEGFYHQWIRSRWFLPNPVRREMVTLPLNGRYMPFWLYDTDTQTEYTGSRGTYYYVTVQYTTVENGKTVRKSRQERRTSWRPVRGCVNNRFRNILVAAGQGAPKSLLDELEPWDMESLTDCAPEALAGFQVEAYHIGLADGFLEAAERVEPKIDSTIRDDIGGDEQIITSRNIQHENIAFKHILLPVYLSCMRYKKKNYRFLVNARTGEVQGERPYSAWKIIFFSLTVIAVIGGVVWFFSNHQGL